MNQACAHMLERFEHPAFVIDARGGLVFTNPAWRARVGPTSSDPWSWLSLLAQDSRIRTKRVLEKALAERAGTEVEFSVRRLDTSAAVFSAILSPFDCDDGETGLLGFAWDVTERRSVESQLAFMAGHDPLTGLANRRAFEESLELAVSRAERGTRSMLLLLDLDHLKWYNDAHGHLEGDAALVSFAHLLRASVRSADSPARIGGDEFAVILENADLTEAAEIAERLRLAALDEFVPGAREIDLGVSGGLTAVQGRVDSRVILDRADAALYVAKQQGRHRIIAWEDQIGALSPTEGFGHKVRSAIEHRAVHLVFQPVVRLSDGSVAYYESLARLDVDPDTVARPQEFLPVLARMDLIAPFTLTVVEFALHALADNPGVSLSVNIGADDLVDEGLLEGVESLLRARSEESERLVVEIAEEVLLGNLVAGRRWMERLSALGCRVVLDDFGTGLGLFVLLHDPHIVHVKISRTMVSSLVDSQQTRAFVRAVRELIESQDKVAVATFIETDELLNDVKRAGFQFGQGYELAEPSASLSELVARMKSAAEV
jgi:diguanylate cyclase (GGDEF)-like protein/PAS domain S-box-containing protein